MRGKSDPLDRSELHGLLERLLDLDGVARDRLLDDACVARPELRTRLEALLAADAAEDSVLDGDASPFFELLATDDPARIREVGAYRIVRELGRGGMGVVFLAERMDPELRQHVALKVIGPRPDADALAERFRRERQILANLRHPNIAQLLDGGVTAEGLPWLAMEYVEGERIDRWCDDRSLTIDERLRAFVTVCGAVQHAQQHLVVHRDLKPSNVLVTADGTVKLLDFGIAKLLPTEGDPPEDLTRTAFHALTPRYASPEQIRRGTVSTASDVYALGVMLHELLTGVGPYPPSADPFESARMVLEAEPMAPSEAVGAAGDPSPEARAAARRTTPDRLRRKLRGELDAIVLKALRKDAADRYPSAAAFRADLERHLRHEPVVARPDRAVYRMRKFVRRRRGPVAAAVLVLGLTAAFGVLHTARITEARDHAELEARKAAEVQDFLVGLFTSNLPQENLGEDVTVAEILERGVARADSLADRPELQALLHVTLGDVYRVLGRYDQADPLIQRSVQTYRALGSEELGLSEALLSLSLLHYDRREYELASDPAREALAIQRRLLGEDDPKVLSSLGNVATLASHTGDVDQALRAHEELLDRRRRLLGPDDPAVGVTLNNIGAIHYREGRFAEAEQHFRQVAELRRRILPREHPDVALSLNNLASVLRELERLDEAEALFREALELRRGVLGEKHPQVAVSHYNLARLLHLVGDLGAAETHFRSALEIDRLAYGPDHPEVGVDAYQLGMVLAERGDCLAALEVFSEATRVFELAGRTAQLEQVQAAQAGCLTGA